MYDHTPSTNPRRVPSTTSKSRPSPSTIFKRQFSGHVPSLTSNSRPFSNSTNLPSRVNTSKRKTDDVDTDSFEYDVPTSNYASVRKAPQPSTAKRIKPDQPPPQKKKPLPEDTTLRIVTSTVQGMKHWTQKQLPYPILFEIFGKLDSQLTPLSSTNTRQFSLIDDNDRIECVFAEMDQSFSNVDRDVQLRILCRMDHGSLLARCIAIRVANEDEWHERRAVIKQCDVQLNEDDLKTKKNNNKKSKK